MLTQMQFSKKKWLAGAFVLLFALILSFLATNKTLAQAADTRPNIILLVVDDAGFSDFYASDTETSNVEGLRAAGVTLTQFHVMPTCAPTRSVLLSGMDNHIAGTGSQGQGGAVDAQTNMPGYEAYLRENVVTIATLLKDSGYHTYMVGKWHLGVEEEISDGQVNFPRDWWPIDRGFERSNGMLEGGGEHYGDCGRNTGHCTYFIEDDEVISTQLPPDYFSAKWHTDKSIEFIDWGRTQDDGARKPFFLYYADTLAHEPSQVPAEYITQANIDLYYNQGWDGMRISRLAALQAAGIIDPSVTLPARYSDVPDWNDVSDPLWNTIDGGMEYVTSATYGHIWGNINTVDDFKRTMAKKMAAYTGMVNYFDDQVGRIIQHTKDIGEYNNTLFIFFSDNGGDPRAWDYVDRDWMSRAGKDNSYANVGDKGSFVSNGQGWGQVANTPLDTAKIAMGEGGVRSPAVIVYPGSSDITPGSTSDAFTTVQDIGPTVLAYAGVSHPVGTGVAPSQAACTGSYTEADGTIREDVCPMNGKNLRDLAEGTVQNVHLDQYIGWELFGAANTAMYQETSAGLFKIRKVGNLGWGNPGAYSWVPGPAGLLRIVGTPWSLYNLTDDPTESNDLAASDPARLQTMLDEYYSYLNDVGYVDILSVPAFGARLSTVAENINPSSTVTHTMGFANYMLTQETYTVSCVSDWACSATISGTQGTTVTLGPGGNTIVDVTVTVPTGTPGGTRNATQLIVGAARPELSTNGTAVTGVAFPHVYYFPVIGQNGELVTPVQTSRTDVIRQASRDTIFDFVSSYR